MRISETCKNCRKKFDSGIWISPEFNDEKVLLFCSDKCKKEYLKMKLNRIKVGYPRHYGRLVKSCGKGSIYEEVLKKNVKNESKRN